MPHSPSPPSSVSPTTTELVAAADPFKVTALGADFPLGPLDALVYHAVPIAVCFLYPPPPSAVDVAISYTRLRTALSRLLDYYPQLTGRLRIDAQNHRSIDRLGAGAHLSRAECSSTLDSFRGPGPDGALRITDLPGGGNELLPPYDPSLEGVCRDPILAVQYTRFACGGVGLGVRCHHSVCDGTGFYMMVGHLAELYSQTEGEGRELRNPPVIEPYLATFATTATAEELEAARAYVPRDYVVLSDTAVLPGEQDKAPAAPVVGRVIELSAAYLANLKARASPPGDWVSTYEALCAALYQGVHRARVTLRQENPTLPLLSPPDFLSSRSIRPDVPRIRSNYFPNAVSCLITTMPPDALFSSDLSLVGGVIHACLQHREGEAETERTLRWLAAREDTSNVGTRFRAGNGAFMMAQWSRFDMYKLAEMRGTRPVLVAPPFTVVSLVDGLGYTLPPTPPRSEGRATGEADGGGGLTLNLSLSEPLWGIIDRDDLFGLGQ